MAEINDDINDRPLHTDPPMSVGDVLDKADGVYFCIKNHESVFLWVNDNFAKLIGTTKEALIGTKDDHEEHVKHDQEVMKSGKPLLNFHETIAVPTEDGKMADLEIVTQKGLLRKKGGNEIIGITVCFSKRFPDADQEADKWIKKLNMFETGIGGYLAHGPGGDINLLKAGLPERFNGDRNIYSSNYFLLKEGDFLTLHALNQDEQWFFHQGSAIKLHIFADNGQYTSIVLGSDIDEGQILQASVGHNQWFGAELLGPGYALVSCSLAPAWDKRDSFSPSKDVVAELKTQFPEQSDVLEKLSPYKN